MRTILHHALLLLMIAALSSGAIAKQCRDDKGKFTKCEATKTTSHCRDIKTKKFAKCGLPGTEPVP